MNRAPWRLLLLPALFVLLQAGICKDESTNPLAEGEEFVATIVLAARSLALGPPPECIHLFLPGENFPAGRVCAPGAERQTSLLVKRGTSYVFRAGRNEVILDEQSCRVTTDIDKILEVNWIGAGLTCGRGFD